MGTCCTMVSRMKISSCVQDGLNLSATYNVAMMYHHGLHVKRNAHKALEFFQESHGVREVAYRVLSPFDSTEYGDEYLALTPDATSHERCWRKPLKTRLQATVHPKYCDPSNLQLQARSDSSSTHCCDGSCYNEQQ